MAYASTGVSWRNRAAYDERGDILLGWFVRIVTFLLLLGIVGFELISLLTARVQGADTADQIAVAAADAFAPKKSEKAAYAAAEAAAIELKAELIPDQFVVTEDGSVDLKVRKVATTLFLYRTDATAKWAIIESEGHANGPLRSR